MEPEQAWTGCLLGAAVGDALGLPREGLSRRRAARMFGEGALTHRFFLGRGWMSDDGEHACMVAQALLAAQGDSWRFARSLSWRLRGWLLGVPAGIGLATLRAILKLWIGLGPQRSGVYSAGNGPAMRAALVGLYCRENAARLPDWVAAATNLTHTDPRALEGALAVAWAARWGAVQGNNLCADDFFESLAPLVQGEEFIQRLAQARAGLAAGQSAAEYADGLGLVRGVTGYVNHTVPVAIYCWLRHPADFRGAVEAAIRLGGDSDTVGSIVGALAGATQGAAVIPDEWLWAMSDWPRSVRWMRRLAARGAASAAGDHSQKPCFLFWPALAARNLLFLAVVLGHGFRRLLPPY